MGALAGAAAVLGSGFFSSLWQLFESLWAIPVAVAALCTAVVGVLVWRARRRPVSPGDPRDEIGDDTIAMVKGGTQPTDRVGTEVEQWLHGQDGGDRG